MFSTKRLQVAAIPLALIAFASNSLLCRRALRSGAIDPGSFTLVRLASGAVALALLARTERAAPSARRWSGALALFVYAAAFSFAYVRIPAGVGALALFGATQATMMAWGLARGELLGGHETVGVVVALLGLAVLAAPGLSAPDTLGVVLMLGAGVAWGAYSLLGRSGNDPIATNARAFAWAVAPAALLVAVPGTERTLSTSGVALAVVYGALTSGVGYSLWYAALPLLSPTRAAVVQLTVPVLAAVAGVVLLGEPPSFRLAASGLVILGGVGLAVLGRAGASPQLTPAAARPRGNPK